MMQIPTPSGWQRTKVGLISKIKYGLGVPPKQLENGTPMLRATNVKRGRIATEGLMRIDASAIPGAKDAVLREGDIIVVRSGAYTGDSALVTGEWAGSIAGYDLVISPDQSVVPAFLALWMLGEGAQSHFRGHRERSAQPHLNRQQIAAAVIDLPPLAEQRQIARVLSAAQRAIERQERLIALTAELKNAIMRKLFTEGTLSGPQKQSSDIGPIPANWDVRPLSDLTAIPIVDGTHKTPTYRTDGIPFITAKDIVHNAVCLDECRFVSKDEHTLLTRRIKPQRGDILLTKVGTVGNVALVESDFEVSIFVQLALIRPNPNFLTSEFLYWALQTRAVQNEILSKAPQSTMKFIGTQKIATLKIPLAPLSEQGTIAEILGRIRQKEALLRRNIATFHDLFRTLIHQLMTAQIRVHDLDLSALDAEAAETTADLVEMV